MKKVFKISVLILLILLIHSCKKDEDIEGNVFHTVTIGKQVWMVENLKTTKLNNHVPIPQVTDNTEWLNLTTPGYCYYNNNDAYKATYGGLYNFYTVSTGKLCPTGWHVPSDDDWTALIDYLGGNDVAGDKLKEIGTTLWKSPNTGATNESGFTALPGGFRDYRDGYFYLGTSGIWWSSTDYNDEISSYGWSREMKYNSGKVFPSFYGKILGFSVRCLKN